MPDPFDSYIAALGKHLGLSDHWKRRVLAEVRSHLEDAADHYRRLGRSRDEAMQRAFADFGEANVVAQAFESYAGRLDNAEAAVVWFRDWHRGRTEMVELEIAEVRLEEIPEEKRKEYSERTKEQRESLRKTLGAQIEGVSKEVYQIRLRERGGERTLCIYCGVGEGLAIAMGMQGVTLQRPMTHDFIKDLLGALEDLNVERVVITKLEDETFYAVLEMSWNDRLLTVDCRPSDGIALALRLGIPIFAGPDLTPHFIAA